MSESVIFTKDYGHIQINLKSLLDERNMTRYCLAKKTGARFEVIDRWYNGKVAKIDADILARICYVLDCDISDIIEYRKK